MKRSSNEPTGETEGTDLTISDRYGLLAVKRRRLVLDILAEEAAPVELEELALEVARRERGHVVTDENSVNRVKTSLHHVHLPKLAEAGLLDYDTTTHRIDPDAVAIESVRINHLRN